MAYLKQTLLIFLLTFIMTGFWFYSHKVLTGQNYSTEIEKIIVDGKSSNLIDLTQFKSGVWDEIAIWLPYSDIRNLKVDGIFLLFDSSYFNSNETSNILLFLKNNRIKGYANFDRKKVDFATSDFGSQRIVRNKAIFKFNNLYDFSKVEFLSK